MSTIESSPVVRGYMDPSDSIDRFLLPNPEPRTSLESVPSALVGGEVITDTLVVDYTQTISENLVSIQRAENAIDRCDVFISEVMKRYKSDKETLISENEIMPQIKLEIERISALNQDLVQKNLIKSAEKKVVESEIAQQQTVLADTEKTFEPIEAEYLAHGATVDEYETGSMALKDKAEQDAAYMQSWAAINDASGISPIYNHLVHEIAALKSGIEVLNDQAQVIADHMFANVDTHKLHSEHIAVLKAEMLERQEVCRILTERIMKTERLLDGIADDIGIVIAQNTVEPEKEDDDESNC